MVNDSDKYLLLHKDGESVIESDAPAHPDSVVILAGPYGTVDDATAGRYKLRDKLKHADQVKHFGHAGESLTLDPVTGRASAVPPPPHPDAPKKEAPPAPGSLPSRANPPIVPLNQPKAPAEHAAEGHVIVEAAPAHAEPGRPTPPGVTKTTK